MGTKTADIPYDADGAHMIGYLAVNEHVSGRPGILICHEGPGLNRHAKNSADQLAKLGYVAFAMDYYRGGTPPPSTFGKPNLMPGTITLRKSGPSGVG